MMSDSDPIRSDDGEREDRLLLSAWMHGDTRAGRGFYARFGPAIKQYFRRRVCSIHDVADLVQETFLRCHTVNFRGEGSTRALLFGIAYRVFMEFLRSRVKERERRWRDDELLDQPLSVFTTDPEYVLKQKEETRLLMKAMRRIPLRYQLVLEMSRWEELTQAEIAAILKCPAPTVGRWKSEGIDALELQMKALSDSPTLHDATTMSITGWRGWLKARTDSARPHAWPTPGMGAVG